MNPLEIHIKLQDQILVSVDQLKHQFVKKKKLIISCLRNSNLHCILSNWKASVHDGKKKEDKAQMKSSFSYLKLSLFG